MKSNRHVGLGFWKWLKGAGVLAFGETVCGNDYHIIKECKKIKVFMGLVISLALCFTSFNSAQAETELDYMEYASDEAAQSAYVSNDTDTKLLLHFDNNVVDSGTTIHTITNNSVTFSSGTKKFGSHAAVFAGSEWLTAPDHADWQLGGAAGGDFTIDYWIKTAQTANSRVIGQGSHPNEFFIRSNGLASEFVKINIGGTVYNGLHSTTTITDDAWHHIAVVRDVNTLRLFIDGVQEDTEVVSGNAVNATGNLGIGRNESGASEYFDGIIDELRISNVARWVTGFSVPTSPYVGAYLLSHSESTETTQGTYSLKGVATATGSLNDTLTKSFPAAGTKLLMHMDGDDGTGGDGATVLDSSGSRHPVTNVGTAQIKTDHKKLGNGSVWFDGDSDYLTVPDSDDWDFGTGDFAIDFWIRFNVINQYNQIMDTGACVYDTGFYINYNGTLETLQMVLANGGGSRPVQNSSLRTYV